MLTYELDRVEKIQRARIERRFSDREAPVPPGFGGENMRFFYLDAQLVVETKKRIAIFLAAVNLFVLGASAAAGYFLAGRTLRPIEEMVNEQNRFVSDASHELRTPLTALKSEIEINLRNKKLTLNEARRLLASNLEEVDDLQQLSDRLIKLSLYQKENKNGLVIEEVSLSSIIEQAIRKIKTLAKNKNIAILKNIKECKFKGDEPSLIELFAILLDNAIKYSSDNAEVAISSKKSDGCLLVSVSDRGIGIAKSKIPNLFKRFYRADESRVKSEMSGYGLGLSIAKEIVERHKGQISVQSELNKGSIFTVQIPVRQTI